MTQLISEHIANIFFVVNITEPIAPKTKINLRKIIENCEPYKKIFHQADGIINGANALVTVPLERMYILFLASVESEPFSAEDQQKMLNALKEVENSPMGRYENIVNTIESIRKHEDFRRNISQERELFIEPVDTDEAIKIFNDILEKYQKLGRIRVNELKKLPAQFGCKQLRSTYRKLALVVHPDKKGNQEDFKKLGDAYAKLSLVCLEKS